MVLERGVDNHQEYGRHYFTRSAVGPISSGYCRLPRGKRAMIVEDFANQNVDLTASIKATGNVRKGVFDWTDAGTREFQGLTCKSSLRTAAGEIDTSSKFCIDLCNIPDAVHETLTGKASSGNFLIYEILRLGKVE